MTEHKFRIKYKNLKSGKIFNIKCIDKVYYTIKTMEKNGTAIIIYDERRVMMNQLLSQFH